MTDFHASGEAVPIESIEQLVDEFHLAAKPRDHWRIGTEYEKIAVDAATGSAVPFSGPDGIETLMRELVDRFGWEPEDEENGRSARAQPRSRPASPSSRAARSSFPASNARASTARIASYPACAELIEVGAIRIDAVLPDSG